MLELFPPRFSNTVADHITFGPTQEAGPTPDAERATAIGLADDGAGVEALVVEVAGSRQRPDAGTFHITWSLEVGRDAHESNDVITEKGWEDVGDTPSVELVEARWP